jgi:hypothetical protein
MGSKTTLSALIIIAAIILSANRKSKRYNFNDFDSNLVQYPAIYEDDFFDKDALAQLDNIIKSNNISIIFDDPGIQDAGEGAPIDHIDCTHPYMIAKGNKTYCAFPNRIDIAMHYLKTGGFENRMESYEKMAARVMSFRRKFLDNYKEEQLKKIYGEKFSNKAREMCAKNDNSYDINKLSTGLFQFDVILMVAGQELPMHLDIPYFWTADRKNIPHWLLVVMKRSKLFDHLFIPQVQGVSWLSKHQYEKLETESIKNGGNFFFYPYKEQGEKYILAKSQYNSALLVDGTQVIHGVERFMPDHEQPPMEKNNEYYLAYNKAENSWSLHEKASNRYLSKYPNENIRVSLVWRTHCFKDEEEKKRYHSQTNRVSIEEVLDVFRKDLKKKGKYDESQEAKKLDFFISLIEEYVGYPAKHDSTFGLPVINYCLLPLMMPKFINDLFLNSLFKLIC